jgi:hypothetical protein
LEESKFDSQQEKEMFFFPAASRPALGPIHPPIKWVNGGSHRLKRLELEAYNSFPLIRSGSIYPLSHMPT